MKREFLLNIIVLIGINLLIKPIYIFSIEAQVQNAISPSEWSVFITLLSLCYIFQIVNDVGIHSFNLQFIPKNRGLISLYTSQILAVKSILLVFYFICICLAFWILQYDSKYWLMLLMIGFNQVLNSLLMYLRSNISGLSLYRWDSFLSILDKSILIIIIGWMLYGPSSTAISLYHFITAQGISFFIPICIAIGLLIRSQVKINLRYSWTFLKELIAKTYPYAIIFLLMTAYSKVDVLMIDHMHHQAELEIDAYSASLRLFDASNMFAYLFVALLLPMVARLIAEEKDLNPFIDFGLKIMSCFAICIAIILALYGKDLLPYIYDRNTDYISEILLFHMIGFIGVAIAYIYGSSLVADGNVMLLNVVFALCLLLNIAINYFIIPSHGAVGAAIASAITQLLSMAGQVIVAHVLLPIRTDRLIWLKIIVFGVSVCLVFFVLNGFSGLSWWISSIIGIIMAGILALWMDMIQRQELLSLFRKKIDPR